jgi:hypothetical protein
VAHRATFVFDRDYPVQHAKETKMAKGLLRFGAVLTLLLASAGAYADDPTGVLLSEQRAPQPMAHRQLGAANLPAFSDVGPCQAGMQSEAFPNRQGYRCVPIRQ